MKTQIKIDGILFDVEFSVTDGKIVEIETVTTREDVYELLTARQMERLDEMLLQDARDIEAAETEYLSDFYSNR
jgi:hypothetical protein